MTQGMMADVNPALENIAAALRSIATAITVGQIGQDVDDDPVAAMAGKAKRTPAFSSGIGERNQMIRDLLLDAVRARRREGTVRARIYDHAHREDDGRDAARMNERLMANVPGDPGGPRCVAVLVDGTYFGADDIRALLLILLGIAGLPLGYHAGSSGQTAVEAARAYFAKGAAP